jgi:hypothetical protein
MIETIYLVADRYTVKRMTKGLPQLHRGEIPIKLELTVEDAAFREPVIEKQVHVEDWRQGVDIADVEFRETTITEEEASLIRQQRLKKMREILESQGFQVVEPEPELADIMDEPINLSKDLHQNGNSN